MKRYPIKILFCLIGIFLVFRAGPASCGWVDSLEDWSRRFHEFEESFMDSTGWWVAREIGGPLARLVFWEETMSKLNPIGNALTPIEEQIPGLDIRGKIIHTLRLPLHGNIYEDKFPSDFIIDPRTGRRTPCPYGTLCGRDPEEAHADPDLLEATWLTELEFDYKPVPWFRFDTIFQYRYEAAYDWDDQFAKLYTEDRYELEEQGYRTPELILREFYMTFWRGPWEIVLGKHQVAWGKIFTRVMDFINPDFKGTGIDESGRHPLWMANFKYWWKNWHFQYIFTPDWEQNIDTADFTPTNRARRRFRRLPWPSDIVAGGSDDVRYDKPGDGFDDSQHGFRAGFEWGKWELDLAYWYGWTHHTLLGGVRQSTPTFRRVLGARTERVRGVDVIRDVIVRERQEVRVHHIGLSIVRPFYKMYRDWIVRLEGVLTKNYYWPYINDPEKVGTRRERFDPDGRKKKDILNIAFEVSSVLFRDFSVTFTGITTMVLPYDSKLSLSPATKLHNIESLTDFSIRKSFFENNCGVRFSWRHRPANGDGEFRQSFSYDISEFLGFSLSFREYYGSNWNDPSGQHNSADNYWFEFSYSF